jgi:hypothetical protein
MSTALARKGSGYFLIRIDAAGRAESPLDQHRAGW